MDQEFYQDLRKQRSAKKKKEKKKAAKKGLWEKQSAHMAFTWPL